VVTRTPSHADRTTLGVFVTSWIDGAEHLAPKTRDNYRWAARHIQGHPIARKEMAAIAPSDVRALYDTLAKTPTMRRHVHVLLRRVLEEAVTLELITMNAAAKVPKPHVPHREFTPWTPPDILAFLKAAKSDPFYALYLLALTTTMGPAELFGLQRSSVHLDAGYLVVEHNLEDVAGHLRLKETKTRQRRRRIDLPPIAIDALREHLVRTPVRRTTKFVFTDENGGPLRRSNFVRRSFEPLMKKAGVPRIRFYDLRHSANALMGYLGVPLQVASARMGHASITLTADTYGHLYPSMGADVAVRLGDFLTEKKIPKKG
jgi:integrase